MTNLMQPRPAAALNSAAPDESAQEGELATLVRRWMATGGKVHDRAHRGSILRVAPETVAPETVAPETVAPETVAPETVAPETVAPETVAPETVAPETAVGPERVETAYRVGATPTRVSGPDDRVDGVPVLEAPEPEPQVRYPPLPQRAVGDQAKHVHRVALLIDARRVSADVASGLLQRLGERGSVNVCRAYADWSRTDLSDWIGQMRREGLHSFHHFAEDDDQALVAMTIDAVDIARDAAVDEVVIAGDLTSALPLVHRLHAAGVRVVAVGSGHTPHDVRAACHEFIDTSDIDGTRIVPIGRHRA